MIKRVFLPICLLLFLGIYSSLQAQNNANNIQSDNSYETALDLFKQKKYVAAQSVFDKILQSDQTTYKANAAYYDALCAYYLEQNNAEFKLTNFLKEYPESAKSKRIQFQLGRLYFNKRSYRKALNSLIQVDHYDLNEKEKQEYNFKIAYCFLNQKNIENARKGFQAVVNTDSQYAPASKYYLAHLNFLEKKFDLALPVLEGLKSDPQYSKIVPYYLIQIYYYQKDFNKIMDEGPTLYETSNPQQQAEIAKILGAVYFQNEDYVNALNYYQTYERTKRNRADDAFNYHMGICYYNTKQYQQAIRYFQMASRADDALAQSAFYYLGHCYLETDQKKYASNAFKSATKLNSNPEVKEEALFNYAKLSIELGHDPYNEAINALNDYLKAYPSSNRKDEVHNYLVQLFINTKNYRSALTSIEQLKSKNPAFGNAYQKIYYYSAIELFNDRRNEEAIQYFTQAIQNGNDPKIKTESEYWIAEAFYKMGNTWAARKYYNQFLQNSQAKRSAYYALAKYNLAYLHFNKEEYQDAIRLFEGYLRDQRNNNPKLMNDVNIRIGDSYFINRRYQQAITHYDRAIRFNQPNKDYAIYQKAMSYGALGNQSNKIVTLEQMITSNRQSAFYDDAMYELGQTYLINNQDDRALSYFSRLVREQSRSPFSKKALLRSGLIYYNNDQNNQAINSLKNVIRNYQGSAESTEALATLKNIYVSENRVNEFIQFSRSVGINSISVNEQDSLSFSAAENQYLEGNMNSALSSMKSYIRNYPNGAYLTSANFYVGEIAFGKENYDEALQAYEYVNRQRVSRHSETALLKASRINYNQKNYQAALNNYTVLYDLADDENSRHEAQVGSMRCNFKLGNYGMSIDPAKALLKSPKVTTDQIAEAHFILAKSYHETNRRDLAKSEFNITEKLNDSEQAAEAKYHLALYEFQDRNYKECEKLLFELADQYSYYDYWLASGFILLADNYLAQDNSFQAKQTLQSIIDNYEGDDLRRIATEKLQRIEANENQ
ncbi:MAG: hypothetical protein CL663_03625 [Bacteroidetes bacterium]|nr:hypothetical protein [Bacteroidota bacterium]